MKSKPTFWSEETLFRIGAFFLAFVLWLSLLDRKEFQVSHSFNVEFVLPENSVVSFQSSDSVRVRLAGTRQAVKNWIESLDQEKSLLQIDLLKKEPGDHDLSVIPLLEKKFNQLNMVSVEPEYLRVRLIRLLQEDKNGDRR